MRLKLVELERIEPSSIAIVFQCVNCEEEVEPYMSGCPNCKGQMFQTVYKEFE